MAEHNCDCGLCNPDSIRCSGKKLIPDEDIKRAADFFKTIGDETRMKILCAISDGELCVNDIASALEMTGSAVSHQLKQLRLDGQVKSRRDGKNIFYSLDDQHVVEVLRCTLAHIKHRRENKRSAEFND